MDTPPPDPAGTSSESAPPADAHGEWTPPRRSFMAQFWAGFLGFLAAAIPTGAALPFFLDPLVRGEGDDGGGDGDDTTADGVPFVAVPSATVEGLPADGTPMLFTIFKDRIDKWNKFPNERVGSVWLRLTDGGEVVAFNSVCPHLGCTVDYRPANADFYCPCHASAFGLDGEKLNVIPPRDMDTLETKVTDDGGILVAFRNFVGGVHDKVAV